MFDVMKRNFSGVFALLCLVLFAGCAGSGSGSPGKRGSTPIGSSRNVEYLEFRDGEIPHWRKAGTVSVNTGEGEEEKSR